MNIVVVAGYDQSLVNFRGPLLEAMVSAGHSVSACAPKVSSSVRKDLLRLGITVYEVPLDRTGTNPISDIRTLVSLRRLFRVLRPDLVLSYTAKPVIYGSMAARSSRVPLIASMITGLGYVFGGESLKQRFLGKATQILYRWALRANSVVFFQNPDDLGLFVSRGLLDSAKKAVLINGSGVDLNHFRKAAVVTEPLTFLLIARLLRAGLPHPWAP